MKCRVLYKQITEISEDPANSFQIELDLDPVFPPANEQFGSALNLSGCNLFSWPEGSPTAGNLLIGALIQRGSSSSGSGIVPIGNTATSGCDADLDVPGSGWTYIEDHLTGEGGFPMTTAWREAVAGEPVTIRWGGAGGLAGTSRSRSHQIDIAITAQAPTVTATSTEQSTGGTTYTSPNIVTTEAGYIFGFWSYLASSPADCPGCGNNATYAAVAPFHGLTQGYAYGNFRPYSFAGYRYVTGAGTYSMSIERSGHIAGNTRAFGWTLLFFPAAAPTAGYPA